MKEKVEAGALADIGNALKKIADSLFKFINKLNVKNEEKLEDGSIRYTLDLGDNKFLVFTVTPLKNEDGTENGYFKLLFEYEGKKVKYDSVSKSDVSKKMEEASKKLGFDYEPVESSRKLKVTLQKVTSAKESIINLTAITANYDISEANSTLDTVLDNEDFLDALSDEPTSFEITDNDDELNIKSIADFDISDAIQNVRRTYEDFCSEARRLVETLEFYYSNFSYDEQIEVDRLIDGINNCSTGGFGCFSD